MNKSIECVVVSTMSQQREHQDILRIASKFVGNRLSPVSEDSDAEMMSVCSPSWRKRSFDSMSDFSSDNSNMSCDSLLPDSPSPPKRPRIEEQLPVEEPDEHGIFKLTKEQEDVIRLALNGTSFFFTGKAGTGKSATLKEMFKRLCEKHNKAADDCFVHITATTGKAAGDLDAARTINNFMAFGTGEDTVPKLITKIRRAKKQCDVIIKTRVLIIDEISMMSAEMMDKISDVLCKLIPIRLQKKGAAKRKPRQTKAKNGTKTSSPNVEAPPAQRVFGGIQVIVCGDFHQLPPVGKNGATPAFCFKSKTWDNAFSTTRLLTKVFRQGGDADYAKIVDEVREGSLSIDSRNTLVTRVRYGIEPGPDENGIIPTMLYPRRQSVHDMNNRHLSRLPGEVHTFLAKDWTRVAPDDMRFGRDRLKRELDSICRAPVRLELKFGAQVVLLKNIDQENRLCNGSRGIISGFENDSKQHPIVQFRNGITRAIGPESWKIEEGFFLVATRTQIPLMLGWASTVHGAQGETCECCALNLGGCFEKGMPYVQFSRATSLSGMSLDFVPPDKMLEANPEVVTFWNKIVQAHEDRRAGRCSGPVRFFDQKRTGTIDDFFERTGMTRTWLDDGLETHKTHNFPRVQ